MKKNGFISPQEAARMIGVCKRSVYRAIGNGSLPAIMLNARTFRILKTDFLKFVQGKQVVPPGDSVSYIASILGIPTSVLANQTELLTTKRQHLKISRELKPKQRKKKHNAQEPE